MTSLFGTVTANPTSKDLKSSEECILKYGQREWKVSTSLIHNASPMLQQLLKNNVQPKLLDLGLVVSVTADLQAVETVVDFIQSTEFKVTSGFGPPFNKADAFNKCAATYILANSLQIPALKTVALETWVEIENTCLFGEIAVWQIRDLARYVFSNTMKNDTGLRLAVIRLAALYHQKYLNLYNSVLTNKKVQETCSPVLFKWLFLHQCQFPELNAVLTAEEPQAWELAQAYEQQLQVLNDLHVK